MRRTDQNTDRADKQTDKLVTPDSVYLGRFDGPSTGAASLLKDGRKNLAAPATTNVLTIDASLIAQTTSQSVIRYLKQSSHLN